MMQDIHLGAASAESYASALDAAREALRSATSVLIGAGSGLSTAAGLDYFGERFGTHFKNFADYYGISDMASAYYYEFPDEESKWAYWAEHIWMNRYKPAALPLYEDLYIAFHARDCFVLTSNVDGQFSKAGFAKGQVFASQGDYAFMQCAAGCHGDVYSNKEAVDAIRLDTRAGERVRISDSSLVPRCPKCAGPMVPWLARFENFIEAESWVSAKASYEQWLSQAEWNSGFVILEMGAGSSAPDLIRFPLGRLAAATGAVHIRMNYEGTFPEPGSERYLPIPGDIAQTWPLLAEGL